MRLEEIDVWLEVGREGRSFTYCDANKLEVDLGDIVLVQLKGRQMHGLVVSKRLPNFDSLDETPIGKTRKYKLSSIHGVVQRAAVDPEWREWIEATAKSCYISSFKMLKAALPSGWLGARKKAVSQRQCWWVFLEEIDSLEKSLLPRQKYLREFLLDRSGGAWQKDLLEEGFSIGFLKKCFSIGIASRQKRNFDVGSKKMIPSNFLSPRKAEIPRKLTEEQAMAMECYSKISPGGALLLWGVTGSGKTEVYLQMAAEEISKGKNCLILTPEIGLTPQIVDRFNRRFGSRVYEYHSGCSDKERIETWRVSLSATKPIIIIGTRSAIFLPLSPLGLIVLDEEHDSSYKQENPMPCYHARDLGLSRAKRTGAKVVLGSATPSLTTWRSLAPSGQISLARLNNRIAQNSLPTVSIVDMRYELSEGHRRLISRPLMERLSGLRLKGEQAVILVPRRGYSTFLSCRSCGEVVQCPNCDVSLTVHQSKQGKRWLRCHWCDYRSKILDHCTHCGSTAFKPFGAGTQRVMEHLSQELDGLRLLRFDRDTTSGRDGHRRLLEQFAAGDADVLIGTQMLAKGMDLPRVTLAVVLAADGLLHRPDLFAEEQTLQLFMQLAGRAGRGERPGNVLVQTYTPEHPVIKHLVDGCYEAFLQKEAKLRKEAALVPYSRACLIRISSESSLATSTSANVLAEYIKPFCKTKGWSLIGPAPALVERVSGKSRWQILLHGPESSPLPLPQGEQLWKLLPKGVNLSIDPDPIQL